MRKATTLRLDMSMVPKLRERYGLADSVGDAAVIRYVMAVAAGASDAELAEALDSTPGGSSSIKRQQAARRASQRAAEARIAAIAAEYGVQAA